MATIKSCLNDTMCDPFITNRVCVQTNAMTNPNDTFNLFKSNHEDKLGTCECNSWYQWQTPTKNSSSEICSELGPGTYYLLAVTSVIVLLGLFGVFVALYDIVLLACAKRLHQNAALVTTLFTLNCLFCIIAWNVAVIFNAITVFGLPLRINTKTVIVSGNGTFGRFELITTFLAPVSMAFGTLSLLNLSLLWADVADSSARLRSTANFRRLRIILTAFEVVVAIVLVICGIYAFATNEFEKVRPVLAFIAIPLVLFIVVTYFVGAIKLQGVLRNAAGDDFVDQGKIGHGEASFRKSITREIRKMSENVRDSLRKGSVDSIPESSVLNAATTTTTTTTTINNNNNNNNNNPSATPTPATSTNIPSPTHPAVTTLPRKSLLTSHSSSLSRGGFQNRTLVYRKQIVLIKETAIIISFLMILFIIAICIYGVFETFYSWKGFNGVINIIVVTYEAGPILLVMSQLTVLRYVHLSTNPKGSLSHRRISKGRGQSFNHYNNTIPNVGGVTSSSFPTPSTNRRRGDSSKQDLSLQPTPSFILAPTNSNNIVTATSPSSTAHRESASSADYDSSYNKKRSSKKQFSMLVEEQEELIHKKSSSAAGDGANSESSPLTQNVVDYFATPNSFLSYTPLVPAIANGSPTGNLVLASNSPKLSASSSSPATNPITNGSPPGNLVLVSNSPKLSATSSTSSPALLQNSNNSPSGRVTEENILLLPSDSLLSNNLEETS